MSEEKKESIVSSLYAQKRHHESKITYWKKQKKDVDENLRKHLEQLSAVEKKLEKIVGREIVITSHFISRYHERINPVSTIDDMRQHILTEQFINMTSTLGNGEYPIDDGKYRVIFEDNKLLTITKPFSGEELREHRKVNRKKYGREHN
jgi:hypothetical protein